MEEPVTLTIKYEEDEIVSATRKFFAQRNNTPTILGISGTSAVFGFILMILGGSFFFGYTLLLLGLVFFYISFFTYFKFPRDYFRRNINLYQREVTFQFFDDEIHCFSDVSESRLDWSYYQQIWETPDGFYLFFNTDMFTLIPKRVFAHQLEESRFRELLTAKFGEISQIGGVLEKETEERREYLPPTTPPDWR